jgi:hypothetical protein
VTDVSKATIAQKVVVNAANATAQADIKKNAASMTAYFNVLKKQSNAYEGLKKELGLTSPQLINYVKNQAINDYKAEDVIISIAAPGTK